jgi:hypothetical protein
VERNLPRAVDLADTVGGLEPAHLIEKPHPPSNAVDEGKALHGKAAILRARGLPGGFVCRFRRKCGATREETSAVNLTGLVRSVMQMETRGQVTAKTSGLDEEKGASSSPY